MHGKWPQVTSDGLQDSPCKLFSASFNLKRRIWHEIYSHLGLFSIHTPRLVHVAMINPIDQTTLGEKLININFGKMSYNELYFEVMSFYRPGY